MPVVLVARYARATLAMDALLVDGDEIELTPDQPWTWMAPVRLAITALPAHTIKAKGKFAVWDTEIIQAGLLAAGKMYSAPGFATPGAVITCTIIVNPATMSKVYKDRKLPIATVATSGTFLATVAPAVNPATGVPDPLIAKTGTWKVVTEKQSVAKSGQPKPDATDSAAADGKANSASGDNSAEPGPAENKVHWVSVTYQDIDGNPLPDHRIAISTPDGRRVERKTTASGASRVDGVRAQGEAVASLLEVSLRPSIKQPPLPFLGVTVVDEDGLPIEGIELGFTSPSGAELAGETSKKGAVRLDKLPEVGSWKVQVTRAPDGLLPGIGHDDGSGTNDGGGAGTEAGTGDDTATDKPTKRLHLLEVPDVLCRTSSCVIMPEGEAPSDSTEHPAVSGVGIFAAAIRLCEERPEFKLLIAAHTDTVDTTKDNQVLSTERAQMALAILTGDRESFKKLAHARHRISDVKQMLHWCVTAYPDVFTCDPGPIDDKDNTWTPVHTFEQQYNRCKFFFTSNQPDLELTGAMGPMNWGALFDVLQHNIARELGVTVREVAPLREKIKWLDEGRKALGFSEHHPIDTVGKDNYESQSNRRVELLFFKETDILPDLAAAESNPAGAEIYLPDVYERERIEVTSAKEGAFAPLYRVFLREPREAVRDKEFVELISSDGAYKVRLAGKDAQKVDANTVALGFEKAPRKKTYTLRYSTSGEEPTLIYQNQSLFTLENTPPIEKPEGSIKASPPANLPAPTEASDPIVSFSDQDRPVDVTLYRSVNDLP